MKQLAAIQLAGNAIALWLGYYWLSIGEARTGLLLWSLTVALFTSGLFVWMHDAGLAYARDPHRSPFAAALRRLPALLAAAALVLMLYIGLGLLQDALRDPSFKLASWLTLRLRKPVKPATILRIVAVIFWLIRWVALPILLLPWARSVATHGFSGFRPARSRRASPDSWPNSWLDRLLTPTLVLVALWLPFRVLAWHPPMSNFGLEMASFLFRAAIAYLLFAAGLLTLEGIPLVTQRNRAPSP